MEVYGSRVGSGPLFTGPHLLVAAPEARADQAETPAVDAPAARIDPTDRGFTLGDGIFETIVVRRNAVRHLAAHLARFREGARVLDIPLPGDDQHIANMIGAVIIATLATLFVLPTLFGLIQKKASTASVSLDPDDPASAFAQAVETP